MANNIALFKRYISLLDEVYKLASVTSVLDGANEVMHAGANANEIVIPMIELSGMAPYDRSTGYVQGDVTLTNQTVICNYDRGRMFQVDALDDAETAGIAFGRLAGEFIRAKVAPEIDAFRIVAYASSTGIGSETGTLETGKEVIEAIRVATNTLDEGEVPDSERYLFITPSLYGLIQDMDTTTSRMVMERFVKTILVPQTRMNTEITLGDGFSAEGDAVNFLVIHKPAVIQYQKHVDPKIITPQQNQDADAWKFGYHNVGVAYVYEKKRVGIYAHIANETD